MIGYQKQSHGIISLCLKIGNLILEQPTVLVPMAGLTDRVLRQLMDEISGCGMLVSEMIAAEGLRRRNRRTMEMIADFQTRTPQFIQLFGANPDALAEAAAIVSAETAFAGIDLNMGCPVPKVVRSGAGAGLLQDLPRAGGRGGRRAPQYHAAADGQSPPGLEQGERLGNDEDH